MTTHLKKECGIWKEMGQKNGIRENFSNAKISLLICLLFKPKISLSEL